MTSSLQSRSIPCGVALDNHEPLYGASCSKMKPSKHTITYVYIYNLIIS